MNHDISGEIGVIEHRLKQDKKAIRWFIILLVFTTLLSAYWAVSSQRQADRAYAQAERMQAESEERGHQLNKVERAVQILEDQTSPEAQQARDRAVENLIVTVDCNHREALQTLIDQINNDGRLGQITLVGPECAPEQESLQP